MIQRLQSVFLLVCSACLGGTFALPYADTDTPVPGTLFADGVYSNTDLAALAGLVAVLALMAFATIFLFRNRKLQLRLTTATTLGIVAAIALAVGYFMSASQELGDAVAVDDEPGLFLPVAALVSSILAGRYIRADEKLVRSADRLR